MGSKNSGNRSMTGEKVVMCHVSLLKKHVDHIDKELHGLRSRAIQRCMDMCLDRIKLEDIQRGKK